MDIKSCFNVITCIPLSSSWILHIFPIWFAFCISVCDLLFFFINYSRTWILNFVSFLLNYSNSICIDFLFPGLPTHCQSFPYRFYQNSLKNESELLCSKVFMALHWFLNRIQLCNLAFTYPAHILQHDLCLNGLSNTNSSRSLSDAPLCL